MSTPENDPQPDGNSTTPPLPSTQGTNSTPAPFGSTRFSQVSRKSIPPRSFQPAQGQQSIATSLISAYGEDTLEHTDAAHPSFSPVLSHADGESLLVGTPFEASKANEVTLDDLKHSRHGPVRSWFTRWFLEWWLLEIISWLVSAVSIIIISWVLLRYDGHLQEEWGMSMSVNSFISTFSGLSKSAILLFVGEALAQLKWEHFDKSERKGFQRLDSASRGPMGSLILLVRSRRL
jgi:hypothetical protein